MATMSIAQRGSQMDFARSLPVVADMGFEDASPFGLQGLRRETLTILKEEAVKPFAVALSLAGNHRQVKDPLFVDRVLAKNQNWVQEYRVVHLIEKSLWFDGRCDFVMQMTRNPSQIPDNPPRKIREALATAYALHPQATVWYGVPLFGDERNDQGLPVPLTADQVREEASKRLTAARLHARRMGWFYRGLSHARRTPHRIRQWMRRRWVSLQGVWQKFVNEYRQACHDAKRRRRAAALAQFGYVRTGKKTTVIPEHTTRLGRIAASASSAIAQVGSGLDDATLRAAEFVENHQYSAAGLAVLPVMALQVLPLFLAPSVVVACDPFLFIELPDEPGKLRMIGHWYWQPQKSGCETLHVHV